MTRAELLKFAAPVIAMGGVFVSRKVLGAGYTAMTGSDTPTPDDLEVPLRQVILYAAATAVAAAVINTLITRGVARAAARNQQVEPI